MDAMRYINAVVVIFLLAFVNISYALKSDADSVVYIDADAANFNNQTQISTYTGHVVTQQGSLHITSDKLVIYLHNGKVDKMVFSGKPARFKQLPDTGKKYIHGEALIGEYYPKKNKLVLIEQAVVSHDGNISSSRLITYHTKSALITAGDKTAGTKRVRSVFNTKPKPKIQAPSKNQ